MKKNNILLLVVLLACLSPAVAQPKFGEQPKLVVGIVVDQMRWDYLSRYYDRFSSDGFRRLIDQGYSCNNCLINYVPTVTAIGHTSAYTGTTPAFHGICGNNFYIDGRKTYCTADTTVLPVGSDNKRKGQMSPRNLLATTIGDQLRLHTDFHSKVIGVSYKDRAAILPAGHSATSAYWLDTKNRQFITSTYYMTELPSWVANVNKQLKKNEVFKKVGEDIGLYPECGTITTDMAIAALQGEQLGLGEYTDMLCVSYSQTDVIGHKWGTRGERTDEAYLQLDKDLGRLLQALDAQVGRDGYLLFLTADHGAAHNFQFMQDHKLPAGKWQDPDMRQGVEQYIAKKLGNTRPVVAAEMDYRYFFDRQSISEQHLDYEQVKAAAMEFLRGAPHVCFVVDYEQAARQSLPPIIRDRALLGYHYRRSGDILVVTEPGYYTFGSWSSPVGTTHGEWNPYDAHIPLLFYGWKIGQGATSREVHITDIAPTVCQLLHIQQPNACIGEAIVEIENSRD
ncbi:MAG: alkaline phosphatase family protein [Prevotella sp.]|nr:alkaline phosphatase family protein [Prevotella sp.]